MTVYVLDLKFRGPSTLAASPTSSMKRCAREAAQEEGHKFEWNLFSLAARNFMPSNSTDFERKPLNKVCSVKW
jgi:hypothetical protein